MRIKLHWQILLGLVLGTLTGLVLLRTVGGAGGEPQGVASQVLGVLRVAGRLFIQLLKMVIIPLIIATMISGVISLGSFRRLGQLGARTFLYYFVTTALAVVTGLVLVNAIRPGAGADIGGGRLIEQYQAGLTTWSDMILSLVPANVFDAMARTDVLPVIVFSLLFGAALLSLEKEGRSLRDVIDAFAKAIIRLTSWVIMLAPYGVFALVATMIVDFGWGALRSLAVYMVTVAVGLGIHFVVTLPLICAVLGRYSPARLFREVSAALITAFSSASSSATLPITMDTLEENTGVPRRYTSFVLPIGATVNMDGTALYEAVAVVFIAQAYGLDLTVSQQVLIFVTATLAAIGAAAIPSAGLFTMAIVLKAVGLPLEGVALIIGVDRILDMLRTTTNVWGDVVGTVVVARMDGAMPEPIPVHVGHVTTEGQRAGAEEADGWRDEGGH